jgi:predicted Holliday junction resolvase-like endonuclease
MDPAFVILISLIISGILLFSYRFMLTHEVKKKMKGEVHALHNALKEKDEAIKKAQTFKENLIEEAENSEKVE